MMTLHDDATRRSIAERARRIAATASPLWGKMNAAEMMVHITDALRMATGELPVQSRRIFVRFPVIKQLLIYVVPMAKGLPTAPELRSRAPASWDNELRDFEASLTSFGARDQTAAWPAHPAFGTMNRKSWGVLAYKHCDHHLRQFGA